LQLIIIIIIIIIIIRITAVSREVPGRNVCDRRHTYCIIIIIIIIKIPQWFKNGSV